jgi:hypothetical protein
VILPTLTWLDGPRYNRPGIWPHFTRLVLQVGLISALCYAQAPGPAPAPEVSSRETPITFSSRVNLVLVPVVVRDNRGHAIGTLKQDDFQLFDKGKPQVITRFSVEKPATPFIPTVVAAALDDKGAETTAAARTPTAVPTALSLTCSMTCTSRRPIC